MAANPNALVFRRAALRNMLGAESRVGLVIQALRYLKGSPGMARHVAHLKKSLDVDTKNDLARQAPHLAAWVRPAAQQIAESENPT